MTHIWISSQLTHTLGWTLLHFLWQGLALAALCSAGMAMCRAASTRYIVALATLVLMFAAPAVTFSVLERSFLVSLPSSGSSLDTPAVNLQALPASAVASPAPPAPLRTDILLLLVEAWFAGVVFFSLRTAGGLILIERMRRHQSRPVGALLLEKCLALQRRMGIARAVRFCQCLGLEAPAVIGWFRPVVLLPVTALSGLSEDQLAAVISHELAHIRRLDCFVNLFQIAAETVLFYHPAVWWLNQRIRTERENCCDDAALAVCGDPLEYARALTLMEEWRQQPMMAMAANGSPLRARIMRLLGLGSPRSGIRNAGIAASLVCLAGALLAANGLMAAGRSSFTGGAKGTLAERPDAAPFARTASAVPWSLSAPVRQESGAAQAKTDRVSTTPREPAASLRQGRGEGPGEGQSQSQAQRASSPSYVEQIRTQGYDNLTADELISLKVQGVTPEYIQQVKALGLHPTINELISMRVQGIDPQYIKDMRAAGFDADIDQLISMRIQGVTPQYVRDMRAAGIDGDANQFIGLRIQGVTPEYVKDMKTAGFNPSTNQLIGMRVQGVSPQYVRDMRAAGVDGNVNQLIGMRVQGLTPEYVKDMKAVGVNASANQLIGMKVQGLTPEYVKDMKAVGVNAEANQLIGMKVQGLTPEYVKEMKAEGVSADTNELIGMRVQGVTPEYVKSLQDAGLQNLRARDYVRAKIAGITPEFIATVRSHGFKDLTIEKLAELKDANVF